jgi:hypothetical protein
VTSIAKRRGRHGLSPTNSNQRNRRIRWLVEMGADEHHSLVVDTVQNLVHGRKHPQRVEVCSDSILRLPLEI